MIYQTLELHLNKSIDWLKKYPPLKGKIKSIKTAVFGKKQTQLLSQIFVLKNLKDNPWIVQPFEKYEEIRIEDLKKIKKKGPVSQPFNYLSYSKTCNT